MYTVQFVCFDRFSDTGEILNELKAGDFFGEIGILNLAGGINKSVKYLVVAVVVLSVFIITYITTWLSCVRSRERPEF